MRPARGMWREKGEGTGRWPGASPVMGHPIAVETWVRGHEAGRGTGGGHVVRAAGRPGFGMN